MSPIAPSWSCLIGLAEAAVVVVLQADADFQVFFLSGLRGLQHLAMPGVLATGFSMKTCLPCDGGGKVYRPKAGRSRQDHHVGQRNRFLVAVKVGELAVGRGHPPFPHAAFLRLSRPFCQLLRHYIGHRNQFGWRRQS